MFNVLVRVHMGLQPPVKRGMWDGWFGGVQVRGSAREVSAKPLDVVGACHPGDASRGAEQGRQEVPAAADTGSCRDCPKPARGTGRRV